MNAALILIAASLAAVEQPLNLITPPDYQAGPLVVSGFAAFPKGLLRQTGMHLEVDGKAHHAALTARALWPDGSLMILAIEAALKEKPGKVVLRDGEAPAIGAPPEVETMPVEVPGGRLILVRTKGATFLIPRDGAVPFLALGSKFDTGTETYPDIFVLYRDGRTFRRSWKDVAHFNDAVIRKDRRGSFVEISRRGYFRAAVRDLPMNAKTLDIQPAFGSQALLVACEDAMYVHEPSTGYTQSLRGNRILSFSYDPARQRYLLGLETDKGFVIQAHDADRAQYTVSLGMRPERVALYKTTAAVQSGTKLHLIDLPGRKATVSVDDVPEPLFMGAGRGRVVLVSRKAEGLRIDQYNIQEGSHLGGTNLGQIEPPYLLSANGMYFACTKEDVVHVVSTITGDDVCIVRQKAASLGLSPAGDKLALIPEGNPENTNDYGIRVYDTKDGTLILTQPLAREVNASRLAVSSNTRVLAALLQNSVIVADTGEWPYRTVYRVWADAPVVEVRHTTYLSGDPDQTFVYGMRLPVILPEKAEALDTTIPGRPNVLLTSGARVFLEDDVPEQVWKTITVADKRVDLHPYSETFGRPIDLRRYSKWVYTGHLYDESTMWGSRGAQGTGIYSSYLIGHADEEGKPYRKAFLVPTPDILSESGIWGRFMALEEARDHYPLIVRFHERLRSLLTCTDGIETGPFDRGDFPSSPFLDGFLFQGSHGWRNGELGVLDALIVDFLAQPDYERLKTLERAAVHTYAVDMVHFTDRRGDYWSVPPQATGSIRSTGVQHWSGRAGDVLRAGNAAGLVDWFLLSGDRFACEASEWAAEFGMKTKNAGYQMVSLFDLLACIGLAENRLNEAGMLLKFAQNTVDTNIPGPWQRTWLASLYIIPQYLRHNRITGDIRSVETVNTLAPMQYDGVAENLLDFALYWGLSGSGSARRSALRYASRLMRLPLATEESLPENFAGRAEMLQGLYPSLIEKGFPLLRAFPYLLKVMSENGVKEEEVVR